MWRKKGRDHEICNYGGGNQHPRTKIFDYDISMKDMKTLMKSEKERDPWKFISFGDVSIYMQDVDAHGNTSWWMTITKVFLI